MPQGMTLNYKRTAAPSVRHKTCAFIRYNSGCPLLQAQSLQRKALEKKIESSGETAQTSQLGQAGGRADDVCSARDGSRYTENSSPHSEIRYETMSTFA